MSYHDTRQLSREPVVPAAIGPWVNTLAFLAAMVALAGWVGFLVAGRPGAFVALALAIGSSYVGSRHADLVLLRRVHARPISPAAAPQLWSIVRSLAERAGVPAPRLWLMPSDQPNAFTVGRDPEHASIAVTHGLLQALDSRELAGVLAHEVAHIRNRDILLMSFASTITAMFASMGRPLWALILFAAPLLLVLSPGILVLAALFGLATIGALLLQSALSREREFAADTTAAWLTGDPVGLATALRRIERSNTTFWRLLFGGLSQDESASPFQSHPPTSERVARLLSTAQARDALPHRASSQAGQVLDISPGTRTWPFEGAAGPFQRTRRRRTWPFDFQDDLFFTGEVGAVEGWQPVRPVHWVVWRSC